MPETEIPPAMRGDYYFRKELLGLLKDDTRGCGVNKPNNSLRKQKDPPMRADLFMTSSNQPILAALILMPGPMVEASTQDLIY